MGNIDGISYHLEIVGTVEVSFAWGTVVGAPMADRVHVLRTGMVCLKGSGAGIAFKHD